MREERGRKRRLVGRIEFLEDVGVFAHRSVFTWRQSVEARFAALCLYFRGVHGDFLTRSEDGVGEVGRG